MTPTVHQIRMALQNHRCPPRTCHAKVRDALAHISLSQKVESPDVNGVKAFELSVRFQDGYGQTKYIRYR